MDNRIEKDLFAFRRQNAKKWICEKAMNYSGKITVAHIFAIVLSIGLAIVPLFCPVHQTEDYCWIKEIMPHGGNGEVSE